MLHLSCLVQITAIRAPLSSLLGGLGSKSACLFQWDFEGVHYFAVLMISPGAWKDFVIRAVLHKDPVLAWGAGEAEAQPSSMGIEEPHSKKCLKSYLLFWGEIFCLWMTGSLFMWSNDFLFSNVHMSHCSPSKKNTASCLTSSTRLLSRSAGGSSRECYCM